MSDYQRLVVDVADGLAKVGLNRPDNLNALDRTTLEELVRVAAELDARPDVRVSVIYGNGRSFSAGADLRDFTRLMAGGPGQREAIRDSAVLGQRMADSIARMRSVTVASLHGHVMGGGFVLAAACDLRIAAADTVMAIPEVDIGIPLTWGAVPRLVSELGASLARDLIMTCRRFGPADVPGFVHRVATERTLIHATQTLVDELLEKPPHALVMTKAQMLEVATDPAAAAAADPDRFAKAVTHLDFPNAAARYLKRRRSGK